MTGPLTVMLVLGAGLALLLAGAVLGLHAALDRRQPRPAGFILEEDPHD